jgi:hypothetical protein
VTVEPAAAQLKHCATSRMTCRQTSRKGVGANTGCGQLRLLPLGREST